MNTYKRETVKRHRLDDMLDFSESDVGVEKTDLKLPNIFTRAKITIKGDDLILKDLNSIIVAEFGVFDGVGAIKVTPKIKKSFLDVHGLKKYVDARRYIDSVLQSLGFYTKVDSSKDKTDSPYISVFVPVRKNIKQIRAYATYMRFAKGKALTQEILDNIQKQK